MKSLQTLGVLNIESFDYSHEQVDKPGAGGSVGSYANVPQVLRYPTGWQGNARSEFLQRDPREMIRRSKTT